MVDYGYYDDRRYRGRRRRRGSSVLLWIIDALAGLATLVCSAVVIAGLVAPSVFPSGRAVAAFAGLAFPMFYVAEIMFLLYWLIRWKLFAVLPAAVLLAGIGSAGLFFRPAFLRHYDSRPQPRADLTVMTYNVMGLSRLYASDSLSTPQLIARQIDSSGASVVCMQEFFDSPTVRRAMDSLAPRLKYRYFVGYDKNPDAGGKAGLAVYSVWPIVARGTIPTDTVRNRAVWVDVKIRRDTLRIVNCHLQNTSISAADRDFISRRGFVRDTMRERRTRDIAGRLAANYRLRAAQADSVAAWAARSSREPVICGDLNDTPMSYVYRRVRAQRRDAFVESGRGASGTYYGFFNMFRIDFIFVPEWLEVVGYGKGRVVLSDHSPVTARLSIPKK